MVVSVLSCLLFFSCFILSDICVIPLFLSCLWNYLHVFHLCLVVSTTPCVFKLCTPSPLRRIILSVTSERSSNRPSCVLLMSVFFVNDLFQSPVICLVILIPLLVFIGSSGFRLRTNKSTLLACLHLCFVSPPVLSACDTWM